MANERREQARETIFYVVPRGPRFSHVAVVHTAACPLAKSFRNARTWTRNPLDEDRFNRYQPCTRCKPEPTGGWPSAAAVAEVADQQQQVPASHFDGMWGREIRVQAEMEKTAKEAPPSIAAALSARDREIKEVLVSLATKVYVSFPGEYCWCSRPTLATRPEGDKHDAACLAARAVWEKVAK